MFWIILLVIVALLVLWGVGIFNKLVRMRNEVKNAWAQIDVQLRRRYDLIPNLVEAVKGYMAHERGTLEEVVQARSAAMHARENIAKEGQPEGGAIKELLGAETALKGSLANIFALSENYPDLKASENMKSLQEELASTENKVAFSRQAYNDSAMFYNTEQQKVPARFVAGMFGHKPADLYLVEEEEARSAPKVQF
jgi:LemA protein